MSHEATNAWNASGRTVFNNFGSRILAVRLICQDVKGKNVSIYLISAYAPVGVANDTVLDNLEQCIRNKAKDDILLIGCDCNSLEGKPSIGKHGLPHRNDAGVRFLTFLETLNLMAITTYFRK